VPDDNMNIDEAVDKLMTKVSKRQESIYSFGDP